MSIHTDAHTENGTIGNRPAQHARLKGLPNATTQSVNRLEMVWAWASLLVLIVCWDAALRLDQRVPLPRVRIAHAAEPERPAQTRELTDL